MGDQDEDPEKNLHYSGLMVCQKDGRIRMDLDETALKAEIDRISVKIDDIMQKVNRLYPQQELQSTTGEPPSKNTKKEPNSP